MWPLLVVENDKEALETWRYLLTQRRIQFNATDNGEEALRYCRLRCPKTILARGELLARGAESQSLIHGLRAAAPKAFLVAVWNSGYRRCVSPSLTFEADLDVREYRDFPYLLRLLDVIGQSNRLDSTVYHAHAFHGAGPGIETDVRWDNEAFDLTRVGAERRGAHE